MKPKRKTAGLSPATRISHRNRAIQLFLQKEIPKTRDPLSEISEAVRLMLLDWRSEQLSRRNRKVSPFGGRASSVSAVESDLHSSGMTSPTSLSSRPEVRVPSSEILDNHHQQPLASSRDGYPEKRDGVMTDYSNLTNGRRVVVRTVTGGNPPVTTVSSVVQSVPGYQKILQYVFSTNGDHKRPNRHSYETRRIDYGHGHSYAGNSLNNTVISGSSVGNLSLSASFANLESNMYNEALSRLYDNIRGDVDLSVDAFQARQTGVMLNQRFQQGRNLFLKSAPKALYEILQIAKRFRRSNPRDWGSMWLEWTYGWKPLANDIYGAAEHMVLASAKSSSGVSGHPVRSSSTGVGDFRTNIVKFGDGSRRYQTVTSTFQCRIRAYFALTTGGLNSVAGLSSLNPVSIAWELVPYSFVADWFLDIGGYLRNLESSLLYRSDFVSGFTQQRSRKTVKEELVGGNEMFSVAASGSSETRAFNRAVLSSSPMPRPPTFNPKLGLSRFTSAASLLSQQLHSLKHKR